MRKGDVCMRKRQTVILFLFLVLTLSILGYLAAKHTPKTPKSVTQTTVISKITDDIDGDGFAETVTLNGTETETGTYENIFVTVKTTAGGLMKKASTDYLCGKSPILTVADCTSDINKEILVCAQDGETLRTAVFTFSPPVPYNLFPPEQNHGISAEFHLLNAFAVQTTVGGKTAILSLENKKNTLIKQGAFYADGTPACKTSPKIQPYCAVSAADGGLICTQPVTVLGSAEPLCYVISALKFAKNDWQVSSWYLSDVLPIPQP